MKKRELPVYPLFALIVASLAGCARVAPEPVDSNVTLTGQYLGAIEKSEIDVAQGVIDFSAVNLYPSLVEKYTLPNREQYNYLFEATVGERHWLFAEVAHEGGFTVMLDDEFLRWVRGSVGMQQATMEDIDIRQMETGFGPIKYSYYQTTLALCVGFTGIWGSPRSVDGYGEARDSMISGEFCRQESSAEEMLQYFSFVMDRLKLRAQNG